MAHFAELDENNIVVRVNHAPDNITEEEIRARGLNVRRCSYNTRGGVHHDPITGLASEDQSKAFRKNYQVQVGNMTNQSMVLYYLNRILHGH